MEGARELAIDKKPKIANQKSVAAGVRLRPALMWLALVLAASTLVALWVGYQRLDLLALRTDERARLIFFELRLPRVVLAGVVGASLGLVGAALQALFRNPLAEPLTLGVSGGGALCASVAIAFGMGSRVAGLAGVFVAPFLGACGSGGLGGRAGFGGRRRQHGRGGRRRRPAILRRLLARFADTALDDRQPRRDRLRPHLADAHLSGSGLGGASGAHARPAPAGRCGGDC